MVTGSSSVNHIRKLLAEPQIQDELAALFAYYYDEVHTISDIAASESQGIRPQGLENEVYACLHHIARGLAVMDTSSAVGEIRKGASTHLKRLHLDAFKIAVNSFLTEYADLVASLRFFVLEDTFKKIDPDGTAKACEISNLAGDIKKNYLEARKMEAAGNHQKALDLFLSVLENCYTLRQKIRQLNENNLYRFAVAYTVKQKKDAQKREFRNRLWNILTALLAALLSAIVTCILC